MIFSYLWSAIIDHLVSFKKWSYFGYVGYSNKDSRASIAKIVVIKSFAINITTIASFGCIKDAAN